VFLIYITNYIKIRIRDHLTI